MERDNCIYGKPDDCTYNLLKSSDLPNIHFILAFVVNTVPIQLNSELNTIHHVSEEMSATYL